VCACVCVCVIVCVCVFVCALMDLHIYDKSIEGYMYDAYVYIYEYDMRIYILYTCIHIYIHIYRYIHMHVHKQYVYHRVSTTQFDCDFSPYVLAKDSRTTISARLPVSRFSKKTFT